MVGGEDFANVGDVAGAPPFSDPESAEADIAPFGLGRGGWAAGRRGGLIVRIAALRPRAMGN